MAIIYDNILLIIVGFGLGLLGDPLRAGIRSLYQKPRLIDEIKHSLKFEVETNRRIFASMGTHSKAFTPVTTTLEQIVSSDKLSLLGEDLVEELMLYKREIEIYRAFKSINLISSENDITGMIERMLALL